MTGIAPSIRSILEAGIRAPSGDNCQPWRFTVRGTRIEVFNRPESDTSLFNFRQRASLVALGAAIENISIAAPAFGYTPHIRVAADNSTPDRVAVIDLEPSRPVHHALYPLIAQRATNRRRFAPVPLAPADKAALVKAVEDYGPARLTLIEEPKQKEAVAKVIGLNDRIAFENASIHKFLFDHIRWTEQEAEQSRDGLYIKTLELPPPQAMMFRIMKNWPLVAALNRVGLSAAVALTAQQLCRSAAAIGIISTGGSDAEHYIAGGRLFERLWLEATRWGLSVHPMTGVTFLIERLRSGETGGLSERHIKEVRKAGEILGALCAAPERTLVATFRLGRSAPPRARSHRLDIDAVLFS